MNEAALATMLAGVSSMLRGIAMLVPDNVPPKGCEGIWQRFLAEVSFFHDQYTQAKSIDEVRRDPDR